MGRVGRKRNVGATMGNGGVGAIIGRERKRGYRLGYAYDFVALDAAGGLDFHLVVEGLVEQRAAY